MDHSNLDVDTDFFHEEIWPRLAHRIPAMEKLKVDHHYQVNGTLSNNTTIEICIFDEYKSAELGLRGV